MKRKIYEQILEWKNGGTTKPLMILGARQVGKTYIINEFCKNEFQNAVCVNLLERTDIVSLYQSELTSDEKYLKLKVLLNYDLDKENTILFIDEIQESEQLIAELKYFCEKHNSLSIICAGSLLGIKLKRAKFSFPVGKVKMLVMYPMDFEEFLMACNQEMLINTIKECYKTNSPMLEALHTRAMDLYNQYLVVGGMPESVNNYVDIKQDLVKYDYQILNDIISSYFKDMDKYVISNNEAINIEKVFRSIPSQLTNPSNKFQYAKVKHGGRARQFESSIDWLEANNLVTLSKNVSLPQLPLKGFVKEEIFKVFLSDVGLLTNLLELKYYDFISNNLAIYKGPITENYVANQLVANDFSLYFWLSNGTAAIDFLIQTRDGIIPIEVKAHDSNKSKSLNLYIDKYQPNYAIRISSRNFGFENGIKSVPLYAVFCIVS